MRAENNADNTENVLLNNYTKRLFSPLLKAMDFGFNNIEVHDLTRDSGLNRYAIYCYDSNGHHERFTSEQLRFFISALEFVARRVIPHQSLQEHSIIIQRNNDIKRDQFSQSTKSALGFYIRQDLAKFYMSDGAHITSDMISEVRRIYVFLEFYNFLAKQDSFGMLQGFTPVISHSPPGISVLNKGDVVSMFSQRFNIAVTTYEGGNIILMGELNKILPNLSESLYDDIGGILARDTGARETLLSALTQAKLEAYYNLSVYDLRKAIYYHDDEVVDRVCGDYSGIMNQVTKDDCLALACDFSSMQILDILIKKFHITDEQLSSQQGSYLLKRSLHELMIPWRLTSSGDNSNDSASQYQQQWSKINFLVQRGARLPNPSVLDDLVMRELDDKGGFKVMEAENIADFQIRILALKQSLGMEIGPLDYPAIAELRRQSSGFTTQDTASDQAPDLDDQDSDVSTEVYSLGAGSSQGSGMGL